MIHVPKSTDLMSITSQQAADLLGVPEHDRLRYFCIPEWFESTSGPRKTPLRLSALTLFYVEYWIDPLTRVGLRFIPDFTEIVDDFNKFPMLEKLEITM